MGVTSEVLPPQEWKRVTALAAAYFCAVSWNSFASDQPATSSAVDSVRLMVVSLWV